LGIDRNDAKYLEAIREDGKNNYWDLTSYNKENLKDCKRWSEERSKVEALRLEANMARGLADGYFWSLAKDVAIDIRDANGNGSMKITYPKDKEEPENDITKLVKRLLIIVPSALDWRKEEVDVDVEDQIGDFIVSMRNENHFKNCKIEKSLNRRKASRIKGVTHVIMSDLEEEGIIIDIPTTLTSIIMRLRDESTSEDKKIDEVQFKNEVGAFSGQIVKRLEEYKLDEYVTVVKMDNLDKNNFIEKIRTVNDMLNNTHKSMITTLEVKSV